MIRAALLLAAVLPLAAQPKLLINARLDTRSAAAGLEPQYRALLAAQPQPAWMGYGVPAVRSYGLGCDYVRDGFNTAGVVHLEPPDHAVILFRVEGGALDRIRTLSPDCEIDAGDVPVHWLTDVQPAQSVALLAALASQRDTYGNGAVAAIAVHADAAADAALARFVATDQPDWLRLRTVSLLGSARGRSGLELLKKLIAGDPNEALRERAVSAVAASREPESVDLLVSIARNDTHPRMRMQAISGLNRKKGRAVIGAITYAIENDSDVQVRRRAVSTLANLPDGEGIPLLIQVVKTTKDQDLRKQAMSSLGQSHDPRALAFFEDVLK